MLKSKPSSNTEVSRTVELMFRRESGRLVARLARMFGPANLDLAEDAVQEALLRALKHWTIKGLPDSPEAWLARASQNIAVDRLRILSRESPIEGQDWHSTGADGDADARVALLFACCDPVLAPESRLALSLRLVGGLSSAEIANCMCSRPNAIEQRIGRAKRKLARESKSIFIPEGPSTSRKLPSVLAVIYQIFNAGYLATESDEAMRIDLCQDALFLNGLLLSVPRTAQAQTHALQALMLFLAARTKARQQDGSLVLLAEQDRSLWDRKLIGAAFSELERAATGNRLSRFHIEAAIAAEHARATDFRSTDWDAIVALYDQLVLLSKSPFAILARAVAVGQRAGAQAGIKELQRANDLQDSPVYMVAEATFLEALGDKERGDALRAKAAPLFRNETVRRRLLRETA